MKKLKLNLQGLNVEVLTRKLPIMLLTIAIVSGGLERIAAKIGDVN